MVMNEKAVNNAITKEDLERLRKEFYDEMLKIQSKIAVAGVKKFSMLDFSDLLNPVGVFEIEGSKYFGYGDEQNKFLIVKMSPKRYDMVFYDGSHTLNKSKRAFWFDFENNEIVNAMPIRLGADLNALGRSILDVDMLEIYTLRMRGGSGYIMVEDSSGNRIVKIDESKRKIVWVYDNISNEEALRPFVFDKWNGIFLRINGVDRLKIELAENPDNTGIFAKGDDALNLKSENNAVHISGTQINMSASNNINVNGDINMNGFEVKDTWRYIEYSHILHSVNVAGTIPYFFATNSTSPVVVDYTHFAYGGIVNIIRQVYGSDAQIVGQWIEIQIATDTEGTPVMAGLFESDTGNMVQSVSTDSNLKSTRLFMPLPTLDETKTYDVRGWSSGGGAYCEIGAIILKLLVKARI